MELLYKKIIFDELEQLEITLAESINSDIELATEVSGYIKVWRKKNKTSNMYFSC